VFEEAATSTKKTENFRGDFRGDFRVDFRIRLRVSSC
jgi:hypothetical protein